MLRRAASVVGVVASASRTLSSWTRAATCRYAPVVTHTPEGTGRPARISTPRFAALPPTTVTAAASIPARSRTSAFEESADCTIALAGVAGPGFSFGRPDQDPYIHRHRLRTARFLHRTLFRCQSQSAQGVATRALTAARATEGTKPRRGWVFRLVRLARHSYSATLRIS